MPEELKRNLSSAEFLTPAEAAEILRLRPDTLRKALAAGELPAVKLSRKHWLVPRASLNEMLRARLVGC